MPREQDTVALLKRLLAKEVTDVDSNEVLDDIIALRDPLPPVDAVAVTETAHYRAIADVSLAGYCEAVEQLALVSTSVDWQAGSWDMVDPS